MITISDYASNCPISRPIKINGLDPTQFFNGIGWSPQLGWMFDVQDDMEPMTSPPPGAQG